MQHVQQRRQRTATSAWLPVDESSRELTWPCSASQARMLAARSSWRTMRRFSSSASLSAAGSRLRLIKSRLALMICVQSHFQLCLVYD